MVYPELRKESRIPTANIHGPVRLREALASDYLVPAAEILTQLGAESVARIAAPFGIDISRKTERTRCWEMPC